MGLNLAGECKRRRFATLILFDIDYLEVGAEIIISDSFATHLHALAAAGEQLAVEPGRKDALVACFLLDLARWRACARRNAGRL